MSTLPQLRIVVDAITVMVTLLREACIAAGRIDYEDMFAQTFNLNKETLTTFKKIWKY